MRVVRFDRHGGPEVLRFETIDAPLPDEGQVLIRVKALGINRAEALMRAGAYIETPALPSGLGLEAAGVVERLGDGVDGFEAGDAVSVIPPISMARWPTYGECISVPAERVVRHPPNLSREGAAATWMAYLTAYGALIDVAAIRRGECVAITAASSSVGLAAIQISNMIGAIPVAVTRTAAKRQALINAGAAHVIVTDDEDPASGLNRIAGPIGVRVVLDCVGGPILEPLTQAMARGGVLIEYGGLSARPAPFPLPAVLSKSLTLRGYLVHEITGNPGKLEAAKRFILDGLAAGALRPIIAKVFPFEEIADAHRYLESNEQFGKIVVTV
ncbi:zinc-dependent alcohol dehydrogenase family protein [Azospirillum halopraeferens]|uniref:zinc-dependent alcohol dehydrogenase family protein n=1 Tax=Azospirillum halopraeferens TaxID=34010 RepID=UPI000400BB1B|nr:zinc-dependent alcohol dehydrogenase family protein [Azospirillum halopraeferens]